MTEPVTPAWRTSNEAIGSLPPMRFVPDHDMAYVPPADRIPRPMSRALAAITDGNLNVSHKVVSDAEPMSAFPASIAYLAVLPADIHIFITPLSLHLAIRRGGRPGRPSGELGSDEVSAVWREVRRIPGVAVLRIESLTDSDDQLLSAFQDFPLPADIAPTQLVVDKIAYSTRDSSSEAGSWLLHMHHRNQAHGASIVQEFGEGADSAVRFGRRLLVDFPIVIEGPSAKIKQMGTLLDERHLPWVAINNTLECRSVTSTVRGMSMQLTMEGTGWLRLNWAVTDQAQTLLISGGLSDGWRELISTIRLAVIDGQASYCNLLSEPDGVNVIVVPNPEYDQATIELWHLKDGYGNRHIVRSDAMRARWTGPATALALAIAESSRALIASAGPVRIRRFWGFDPPFGELALLDEWLAGHYAE